MESSVTDLLENVVGRLIKIETQQEAQLMRESQIDQVIERLTKIKTQQEAQLTKQPQIDQFIERLDTIHNRQTLLEHKLSDVSTQLGEDKTSIRDQMSTISTQLEQEKVFMRNQLSTISTQLNEEKVFMRDQLKEAQDEILHRLTELQQQNVSTRSQAVSVGEEIKQLQATAGPNPVKETAEFCSQADGDVMDARLAKMSETLEQSVKAVTRAEHVWLDNRTQQCISELGDKVGELAEEMLKTLESVKQENKDVANDFQIDMGEETIQKIQRNIESTVKESVNNIYTELDKVHRNLDKVHTDVDKVHTDVDNTKRDLFVLAERQSYKISRLLSQHGLYICDFYVEKFRHLARSRKFVKSEDWLIKQFCTSVCGNVFFPSGDDKMIVYLEYSKYHSNLGSQLKSGVTLRIKVTITDTSGQLPDVLMGQQTYTWEEKDIMSGKYWYKVISETSCAELREKGYGQREGYKNDALLLRYEIEVM